MLYIHIYIYMFVYICIYNIHIYIYNIYSYIYIIYICFYSKYTQTKKDACICNHKCYLNNVGVKIKGYTYERLCRCVNIILYFTG